MPDPTNPNPLHDVDIRLTRMEGDLKAQKASYDKGWQAIRASMAELKTDIAKRDTDQAKRDADYRASLSDLKTDMAKRDADYHTSLSNLKTDIAQRDKGNQRFLITLFAILIATLIGISEFRLPDTRPAPQPTQLTQTTPQ